MHYIILTGHSKGLGQAITQILATDRNTTVICISRTKDPEFEHKRYIVHPFDLSRHDLILTLMNDIFSTIPIETAESIHLINNAGILEPIKPIQRTNTEDMTKNIHVNLLAPILLTAEFIRHTESFSGNKRIINISSGAGSRPIFGWSGYGAAKAGLDLFSQNVAVDQEKADHPVQICSFLPGIMDTNMQATIRQTSSEDFVELKKFQSFKEDGQLLPPTSVANVIINLLMTDDFPNGQIVNVHSYL